MRASVTAAGYEVRGFMVQPMISDGVELIVGMVQDASFGPVVACGAGGTNTELIGDVSVRITPVTDRDAWKLTSEDVAKVVLDLVSHDPRSLPSRVELRPSRPPRKG